jgi:hypothetical protein
MRSSTIFDCSTVFFYPLQVRRSFQQLIDAAIEPKPDFNQLSRRSTLADMASAATSTDPSKKLALTPWQLNILITIERSGAGLSMVAIVLTIASYIAFRKLRTTPNMFLICASVANAGASCASMIGYDGIRQGLDSNLCQAQAFIFEWFVLTVR